MRIGLFGGSFNPPHVCHQLAALMALECAPIDVLWWVPTYRHAFGKELAPFADRIAMCRLAAAALGPRAVVRDDEAALFAGGAPSRTLTLIEHMLQTNKGASVRLIIGSDILAETAAWHRWDEVVRLAPPWVIPRDGAVANASTGAAAIAAAGLESAPAALPAVASRDIRAQLQATGRAAGLPQAVAAYIVKHGLYR